MKIETYIKEPFSVIGKEGSTDDGQSFIKALWTDANGHFEEVQPLAKCDGNGTLGSCQYDCVNKSGPWLKNPNECPKGGRVYRG